MVENPALFPKGIPILEIIDWMSSPPMVSLIESSIRMNEFFRLEQFRSGDSLDADLKSAGIDFRKTVPAPAKGTGENMRLMLRRSRER